MLLRKGILAPVHTFYTKMVKYKNTMKETSDKLRRRELFGIAGAIFATTTGCLIANTQDFQPYPTQPPSSPTTPTALPTAQPRPTETPKPAEGLPPEFNKVLTQAEIVYKEFPDAFADAANLKDILQEIKLKGRLTIEPIPTPPNLNVNAVGILATLHPQPVVSQNGLIEGFFPALVISPKFFALLPPLEQVMILTHEINHYQRQTTLLNGLLNEIKGKPDSLELRSKVENEIKKYAPSEEARELYTNCRQIFAIRTKNPGFRFSPYGPWETSLPNSMDRSKTLYSIFLEVKDLDSPQDDPRWKAAIENFIVKN